MIHNGKGLRASDRQPEGDEDVFGSGGCVGKHTERLHPGPFVVIGRKGSAGKSTYAPDGGWVTDTAYFAVPLEPSELHCRFLFYAIGSLDFSDDVITTAIPGINRTAIYAHSIPHPPLELQVSVVRFLDSIRDRPSGAPLPELPRPLMSLQRVVARAEKAVAQIEEARTLRAQARQETESLWTSSLRLAIDGCPAQQIVLEDACESIIDNLHTNPRYSPEGIPCVRSPDVGWGTLNLDSALRTDETEYTRRTARGAPQVDDIVLVREGGGTGKCALVSAGQRFSLGQRVMMIRPDKQKVVPKFFLFQLLSPLIQERQILPFCKGSASPHLNIGALRRFRFRLPGLAEQRNLVAKLDALSFRLEPLRRLQAEAAAQLDALLPAILDHTFKEQL